MDAAPLATLSRLEKLTLHGNLIAERPSYRHRVLASVATLLRELDFVAVSAQDRTEAKKLRAREARQAAERSRRTAMADTGKIVAANPYGRAGRANKTMLGSRR
jgi:hypothetical protein